MRCFLLNDRGQRIRIQHVDHVASMSHLHGGRVRVAIHGDHLHAQALQLDLPPGLRIGRGIGLGNKLHAYAVQDQLGLDTVEANVELGFRPDERDYGVGAQILADLGARRLRLMTNNPAKIEHLESLGVEILARLPVEAAVHADNAGYLSTKAERMRHMLTFTANGMAPPEPASQAQLLGQVAYLIALQTTVRIKRFPEDPFGCPPRP